MFKLSRIEERERDEREKDSFVLEKAEGRRLRLFLGWIGSSRIMKNYRIEF